MKKQLKQLIPTIIIAAILILVLLLSNTLSNRNDTSDTNPVPIKADAHNTDIADVDSIPLPDISSVEAKIGAKPKQVDSLTEKYVLRNIDYVDSSVVYRYQQHMATVGDSLTVTATGMTMEEYTNSLPTNNSETFDSNNRTFTFKSCAYLQFINEDSLKGYYKEEVEKGNAEIVYGNTLDEVGVKQAISWYDDGIKYELIAINYSFTKDDCVRLAEEYMK